MKEIKLTNSDKVAIVDDEDYEWLSKYTWKLHPHWRGIRDYVKLTGKATIYMHNMIVGKLPSDKEVDHADRNGLNNTRANLRIANRNQQMANREQPRGKSGFVGVYKERGKFVAKLGQGGKIYVGSFKTPEEAARARDIVARVIYGEFAILNFPENNTEAEHV